MIKPLLQVTGLTMSFGGLMAVDGVDLALMPGEIAALIGPNGAGKTTFFNCITGIYRPTGGDIYLSSNGRQQVRLNGEKPNRITALGMARTFQNVRLFPDMTVIENVMIGRHVRTRTGIVGAILKNPAARREEKAIIEESYRLLCRIGLARWANEPAKNLPYGEQRRLEIARALATGPSVLLLDEPAAGMNPKETLELDQLVRRIRDEEKIAILLIEHDMKLVMSLSDHIVVMDYGKKIAEGTPDEVRKNPLVITAYLGEDLDGQ